jgi:C1A family cysteine protease
MYGWLPQPVDVRDWRLSFDPGRVLPSKFSLEGGFPPIYNQGHLGSCTAHAVAALSSFLCNKFGERVTPSRLFLYYYARQFSGISTSVDGGATLRGAIKAVAKIGILEESEYPYDPKKFTESPSTDLQQLAKETQVTAYYSLPKDVYQLKKSLVNGFPFVFGFRVPIDFYGGVGASGYVPPEGWGKSGTSGHAVCAVGYSDYLKSFLIRNSWGKSWGAAGYFWMPYDFMVSDNCSDFQTVLAISCKK